MSGRAGQELPAGPDLALLGVVAQDRRRLELGLQRDRVHEDVAADPLAEQVLDPAQVRR